MALDAFRKSLQSNNNILAAIRDGVIGDGARIPGLFGDVALVYADYVASGRALTQVEDYIRDAVLPYYANSHTEASYCGAYMTRMRGAARAEIARLTRARGCSVIFAGSGATAGVNRLVHLFGVNTARKAVVFVGPYEHHSNLLPWRESRARVIEIPEGESGGPDLAALEDELRANADADLKIGAFSAASNVTGIITDTEATTRLLKRHEALAVWDYAGGGPYLPIDMAPTPETMKDAVVVSPHKFPGGPGASGVLIVRDRAVVPGRPSWPGGGTVTFVSPWEQVYSASPVAREEAGTPNVVGDIRAALAFIVKDAIGTEAIAEREAALNAMAVAGWASNRQLRLLGAEHANRLPIFSFLVCRADGRPFHHQLFTRMLSDVCGIQARGGCACAGPYAHRLLGIDETASRALLADLHAGRELRKPGWVRLNFSYLLNDTTARYIIDSVNALSTRLDALEVYYDTDPTTARFSPVATLPEAGMAAASPM
ncbi:aminotransferase class V-fold PLP-dependent enzyme [Hoeflea poritis]|uniref:Aminotransferase class V-fold PLP-dependent enzyme n=1 Tax=Hoeflea poritis TaxID=2993659 RepID=A0ABT4VHH7_9HYPH|nr:aminotransferase class V-fold PLP-dependent enzyme [Hoeflea poritis]MDA4844166.1 aminotransferase class V-fold PLP-dependent enzyme [Hoeflea poritis]